MGMSGGVHLITVRLFGVDGVLFVAVRYRPGRDQNVGRGEMSADDASGHESLNTSRSLPVALWCLAVAALLVALVCVVVISHRTPGLFILIAVVPAAGWAYFAVTAALGTFVAAARRTYVTILLFLFQLESALMAARWIDITFGIGVYGSVSVLLDLGIVLVFVGVGVPLLRVRGYSL
jgi:hypothetical protein